MVSQLVVFLHTPSGRDLRELVLFALQHMYISILVA